MTDWSEAVRKNALGCNSVFVVTVHTDTGQFVADACYAQVSEACNNTVIWVEKALWLFTTGRIQRGREKHPAVCSNQTGTPRSRQ